MNIKIKLKKNNKNMKLQNKIEKMTFKNAFGLK